MSNISFEQARILASEYVSEQDCDLDLVIQDDETIEQDFGWVFFYTTKKYLETGDFRDMVVGNAPVIVDKDTGELTETGTAHSIERYIEEYKNNRA